MALPTAPQDWTREGFLISTDKTLLSISAINSAFQQDFIYWTSTFPDETLQQIVNNSFCLGLYKTSPPNSDNIARSTQNSKTTNIDQIGFARLITDNITFAYLTDLYVLPEYQGLGLGGWLVNCVDELLEPPPHLRWAMLRTSMKKSQESYEKRLGMHVLKSSDISEGPVMMGKKGRAGRA
ncbi:unnamed protein product [Penicillium salamii]|nr:unnamed protein product [Penicillium salamii]CAG8424353.1 unnamed protein product [Penicillium salamii]